MEAGFIVNRQIRKEDSIAFARVLYGKIRIVYLLVALAYWAYILYDFQYDWWSFDVVLILLAVAVTLLAALYPRYMAWCMRRAENKKVKECDYTFYDENLHIKTNVDEGTVQYCGFIRIVETKEYFYLFIKRYSAYILPKSDFVLGTPEDFGAFISEKTGLTIKRVRG